MYQDRHLTIDRQMQQIVARDRLIRQLSVLALALAAIAVILAFMLIAATRVYASEACMTKAEARALYPNAHLYWRTKNHCWGNQASIRYRVKHKQPVDAGQLRAQAKPEPKDANGNLPAKKILWPSLVPTVEFTFQSLMAAQPMTLWPAILDVDEVTADPPGRLRNCCWPKLDKDFEARWNEMPP